jgi:hypothetical protein
LCSVIAIIKYNNPARYFKHLSNHRFKPSPAQNYSIDFVVAITHQNRHQYRQQVQHEQHA